jgi:hypothetical protein
VVPVVSGNANSGEVFAESQSATSAAVESANQPTQANQANQANQITQQHPSAEDTAQSVTRQEWADLTATAESHAAEKLAAKPTPEPAVAIPANTAAEDTAEPARSPENTANFDSKPREAAPETSIPAAAARDWSDLASSLRTLSLEANRKSVTDNPGATSEENPLGAGSASDTNPFAALTSAAQSAVADVRSSAVNSSPAESGAPESTPNSAHDSASDSVLDPSAAALDPVLVEAVVQRILEKWRPQVVDIITKEFLRPIVQALVQREILKR